MDFFALNLYLFEGKVFQEIPIKCLPAKIINFECDSFGMSKRIYGDKTQSTKMKVVQNLFLP